jgi:hypothetical protein
MGVCGAMRANREIPQNFEKQAKNMMKAQSLFQKRGDILVQIWKEKLVVWMICRIHELRKERERLVL